MESLGINGVIKIFTDLGMVGLVIYLWWADNKRLSAVMAQHQADLMAVLRQYEKDMAEQREMYRSNASLCRDFANIASDLRDVVTLNIQSMTRLDDSVRQNEFCPMVRVRRDKTMRLIPNSEANE